MMDIFSFFILDRRCYSDGNVDRFGFYVFE